MSNQLICAAVAGIAIAMATTSYAGKPDKNPGKNTAGQGMNPPSMTVVRDKETGQLRAATAQEAAAFRKAGKSSGKRLKKNEREMVGKVQYLGNGTRSMILDPDQLKLLSGDKSTNGSVNAFHGKNNNKPAVLEE